jgi:hypothetical protein
MKNLKKLSINHEKVIKKKELVNFMGGEDTPGPCCKCSNGRFIVGSTSQECDEDCTNAWHVSGTWIC